MNAFRFIFFPNIVTLVNIVSLVSIFFTQVAMANISERPFTFPSLPKAYREQKIKEIQDAFEERSKIYLQGRQFHHWKLDRPAKEIAEEYEQLNEWRQHTWYSEANKTALVSRTDFMVAQDLLQKGFYKNPNLLPFQYNRTEGDYNSSTIVLNGLNFLAMEAPQTAILMKNFFKLLQNHQVTQLVRLTPATDKGKVKSLPYWSNRVKKNKEGELVLHAPFEASNKTYPIRYYVFENWPENQDIDPTLLLRTIQSVKKDYDSDAGLLACHCSGGVGKTGTFIAGFILLQEIDRQIAAGIPLSALDISIEKIVLQLSLQRVQMVSKSSQYLALYRLVDLYIRDLENSKNKSQ